MLSSPSAKSQIDAPTLGMWLFIASEGMFFVALMGAFVVLGSQQHEVFARSSRMLLPAVGFGGAILLVVSSLLFSRASIISLLAAVGYLALQAIQWHRLGVTLLQNNFFGSYLLMSAMHGLHLLAGIIALLFILIFRDGVVPIALRNYWHFVNLVGLFGLASLYFV